MKLPKEVNERFIHSGIEVSNRFLVELINQKKSQGVTVHIPAEQISMGNLSSLVCYIDLVTCRIWT